MTKLVAHIGHPKTGSSYLQSVFALNSDKMAQFGLFYPRHTSHLKAKKGYITSGNGLILLQEDSIKNSYQNILVSSELLFHVLIEEKGRVAALSNRYDLEIVLYVRDVIDLFVSMWGQYVKRHGEFTDLNTFLMNFKFIHLDRILEWMKLSNEIDFKLTVRNYSRCKYNLAEDFFQSVSGVPNLTDELTLPSRSVNRSLSLFELQIRRVFNAVLGASSSIHVSNFFCNQFPNVKSWKPTLSHEAYEHIITSYTESVDAINSVLDKSMHIEIGIKEQWVEVE